MVLNKQAVAKRRKIQVFIVPQIKEKIQHLSSSVNVKNKQSRYRKSQYGEISQCLIRGYLIVERAHKRS